MTTRQEDAKQEILKRIIVTTQHVTLAKMFILNLDRARHYESGVLQQQYAQQLEHIKPERIALRPTVAEGDLIQASDYLISIVSVGEAIWSLIHEGALLHDSRLTTVDTNLNWTTVVAGSGTSGGWTFDEFSIPLPYEVFFSPSHRFNAKETLTDPNLFLLESGITGADTEVIEALKDSIGCFRKGLYRPSTVLLGKAMEGTWIELGISIGNYITGTSTKKTRYLETMTDDKISIWVKIGKILDLYNDSSLVGRLVRDSGISVNEIKNICVWSDVLREARNAIHFGVKPTIPNTYEKVAVLLLASAQNLRKLYHVKKVAEQTRQP